MFEEANYRLNILKKNVPKGKTLYKFQEEGVLKLLSYESNNLYIADEPGVGKTPQALVFANCIDAKKTLIICPASLRLNWEREAKEWLLDSSSIAVVTSSSDVKKLKNPNVLISNYELISSKVSPLFTYMLNYDWDLVILDEAHYIRSIKSMRTKKLLAIWEYLGKSGTKFLLLSGTPLLNSGLDLFPALLRITKNLKTVSYGDRIVCSDFYKYAYEFTNVKRTPFGTSFFGIKNHERLKNLLDNGGFYIRRTKASVLKELPPVVYNRIDLDLTVTEDKVLTDKLRSYDDENLHKLAHDKESKVYMATLRRELGEAKAKCKFTYEIIDLIMEQSKCLVLFFYHKNTKELILSNIKDYKVVIHDGDISAKMKQESVDTFQQGNADILLAQVDAATGYTVTRADQCLFVEYSYLPAQVDQAISRLQRIGQKASNVTAHFLVSKNTLDIRLVRNLISKQKNISKVIV